MGKHFDTLVEIARKDRLTSQQSFEVNGTRTTMQEYLRDVLTRAALFEFLAKSTELPTSSMSGDEKLAYMQQYLDVSIQYGQTMITPFGRPAAIEDEDSVVIFDPSNEDPTVFTITTCDNRRSKNCKDVSGLVTSVSRARLEIDVEDKSRLFIGSRADILALYLQGTDNAFNILNEPDRPGGLLDCRLPRELGLVLNYRLEGDCGIKLIQEQNPAEARRKLKQAISKGIADDIGRALSVYVTELAFINDPANLVLMRTGKERHRKPNGHKKGGCTLPEKTWNRKSYLPMRPKDAVEFLRRQSNGRDITFHVVTGYYRTLTSEAYKAARGRVQYIAQHCKGVVHDIDGGHNIYSVMLKTGPTELVLAAKTPQEATIKGLAEKVASA
ncbi:hypothetical protein JW826_00820 [Candidatus Woesearchaeota archaeon]|nr:hypothetical protein [Candidatus Woesearchaeota archaeon]